MVSTNRFDHDKNSQTLYTECDLSSESARTYPVEITYDNLTIDKGTHARKASPTSLA